MRILPLILLSAFWSLSIVVTTNAQSVPASGKATSARPASAHPTPKPPRALPKPAAAAPASSIKPEEQAQKMTISMVQALGLAAVQAKRVQEINLLSVQRVEEARHTYVRQLARMRAEIELIGNSRLSLLKDVLTEQQFRAYAAMREKKMGIPQALKQQAAMSESAGGE